MLTATYRLPAAEFDESVAEGIQSTFRNKTVEITVREVAETPQERSHRELMQTIAEIESDPSDLLPLDLGKYQKIVADYERRSH